MPPAARDRLAHRRRVVCSRILSEGAEEEALGTARSKKQREQQRAAIRPAATYQSGVRRRLRGRWFHLVPVKQHQLSAVLTGIYVIVAFLTALGYLAAVWAPLALRPLVGRPLRLDMPGGIADWVGSQMLAIAAGTSFLIYQLRRYRGDDYHGRYRMWRPIIALLVLLSLDSVVHLREAAAALIDATWAQQSVIVGSDIVRLALLIIGMAIALPLFGELSRSPSAIALLAGALLSLATPTALRLGIIPSTPELILTWAGAARLAGRACLLSATICYLRRLYREVQHHDDDVASVFSFFQRSAPVANDQHAASSKGRKSKSNAEPAEATEAPGLWSRLFGARRNANDDADDLLRAKPAGKRRQEAEAEAETPPSDSGTTKTSVNSRSDANSGKPRDAAALSAANPTGPAVSGGKGTTPAASAPSQASNSRTATATATAPAGGSKQTAAETKDTAVTEPQAKKGGLGGWFRGKKEESPAESAATKPAGKTAVAKADSPMDPKSKELAEAPAERKGWFSRAKAVPASPSETSPASSKTAAAKSDPAKPVAAKAEPPKKDAEKKPAPAVAEAPPEKRSWFGWGAKKDPADKEPDAKKVSPAESPAANRNPLAGRVAESSPDQDDEDDDDDEIDGVDTSKMSKSEQRRLKKQMRRQGRAA
jgi:hypothetical protein